MDKSAKRVNIVSIKMVRESTLNYQPRKINSAQDVAELAGEFLLEADREKFLLICLDTKNQPTHINIVSIGTLNASTVHPREIFKVAILANSAAIILAHNHPSGDPAPSVEDIEVTKRLVEAGEILGIRVLDHVIVGEQDRYVSFKERNYI